MRRERVALAAVAGAVVLLTACSAVPHRPAADRPADRATQTPSKDPRVDDPLVVRTRFSQEDKLGWPLLSKKYDGVFSEIQHGHYRVRAYDGSTYLAPRPMDMVSAREVSLTIDPSRMVGKGAEIGLICMGRFDGPDQQLGTEYVIAAETDGSVGVYRDGPTSPADDPIDGYGAIPGWDRKHLSPITLACKRSGSAMRFTVTDASGAQVFEVRDPHALPAGASFVFVYTAQHGEVAFDALAFTSRGTRVYDNSTDDEHSSDGPV